MTEDWRHNARCRGLDPNLFFAERGNHQSLFAAMEICNGDKHTSPCPVRNECLEFALSFNRDEDNYGVFGGLSPNARNKIRIKRREYKEPEPTVEYGYPGDNRRMYRSGRPLRSELPDRPLPTDYEWRTGLAELVRLIHETVMADENRKREARKVKPAAVNVRAV